MCSLLTLIYIKSTASSQDKTSNLHNVQLLFTAHRITAQLPLRCSETCFKYLLCKFAQCFGYRQDLYTLPWFKGQSEQALDLSSTWKSCRSPRSWVTSCVSVSQPFTPHLLDSNSVICCLCSMGHARPPSHTIMEIIIVLLEGNLFWVSWQHVNSIHNTTYDLHFQMTFSYITGCIIIYKHNLIPGCSNPRCHYPLMSSSSRNIPTASEKWTTS